MYMYRWSITKMDDVFTFDPRADLDFLPHPDSRRGREDAFMMKQIEAAEMRLEMAQAEARAAQQRVQAAARALMMLKQGMLGGGSMPRGLRPVRGLSKHLNQPKFS